MALMEYCLVNIVLGDNDAPAAKPPPPPAPPQDPNRPDKVHFIKNNSYLTYKKNLRVIKKQFFLI